LDYQNNCVEHSNVMTIIAKNCDILATNLSVLHNYFNDLKLFSDLAKFLDTLTKLFFPCICSLEWLMNSETKFSVSPTLNIWHLKRNTSNTRTSKDIITFCAITKFKESFCHIRVNLTCHSTSGILERNDTPVIRSLRTPDIIVEFMFPEGM